MSFHYLVDGYNLLYALPEMPQGNWQTKREALLRLLLKDKPYGKNRITVVFDSREGGDRYQLAEIAIIFTLGQTADEWISEAVRKAPNPRLCRVVTDDKGIQILIRGTGAEHVGCSDFMLNKSKPTSAPKRPNVSEDEARDINAELFERWKDSTD